MICCLHFPHAERVLFPCLLRQGSSSFLTKRFYGSMTKKLINIPRSNISSSNSDGSEDNSSKQQKACLYISYAKSAHYIHTFCFIHSYKIFSGAVMKYNVWKVNFMLIWINNAYLALIKWVSYIQDSWIKLPGWICFFNTDSFWIHKKGCLIDWSWSNCCRDCPEDWIGGILLMFFTTQVPVMFLFP